MSKLDNAIQNLSSKGNTVTTNLRKACVLVTLRVHRWRGIDQAPGAQITLSDHHISKRALPAKWRLIPDKWNKRFSAIESEARDTIHRYSVRAPIRGSRFVPISRAEELFKECTALRASLEELANSFCTDENFDEIKAGLINDLGSEAGGVAICQLPSPSEARGKFGMDWFVVPMGEPQQAISDGASAYIQEAQATLNKVVLESVEAMLREPREKLLTAVNGLAAQVQKDKRALKSTSLQLLRNAFEEYRNWAFLSDDKTLEMLGEVEQGLTGVTSKSINMEEAVATRLTETLAALRDVISDEEGMLEGFGKFKRAIDID